MLKVILSIGVRNIPQIIMNFFFVLFSQEIKVNNRILTYVIGRKNMIRRRNFSNF